MSKVDRVIDIAPSVFEWFLAEIEQAELSQDVSRHIARWQKGINPTFNQLEKISKNTNIPFGYFFRSNPPKEEIPIIKFRTVDSIYTEKPSRNLLDVYNDMLSIQDWYRDYLTEERFTENDYVGSLDSSDFEGAVTKVRDVLGLEIDWFRDKSINNSDTAYKFLRQKISNIGVIVMQSGFVRNSTKRSLDIEEFRAFALLDKVAPLIFINTKDADNAKMFSLLHEFIHIGLGRNNFYNDTTIDNSTVSEEEVFCNKVVAEILTPISIFKEQWNTQQRNIRSLATFFRCSQVVIARRALDCGFITTNEYFQCANTARKIFLAQRERDKGKGGPSHIKIKKSNFDNNVLLAIKNYVQENKMLYKDAYRLTHTNNTSFENLMSKLGGF